MSSKAEDRYLDLFQDGRLRNCSNKDAFLLGYHQAEKDLELSWRDMEQILDIINNLFDENFNADNFGIPTNKEFYQEVLKRYKEMKVK